MGQVSRFLRNTEDGYSHWCPACEEMHHIRTQNGPPLWTFNGDVERPSFQPSVKITGKQAVHVNGKWTGEWKCGPDGKALDMCCHYFLNAGALSFCPDSLHQFAGKVVPLPELPPFVQDAET